MEYIAFEQKRKFVNTSSGRIDYWEEGEGPVALFVHGLFLNGYSWRHQLSTLSDIRRCIFVGLMEHDHTEIVTKQEVFYAAQAKMLIEFMDKLEIEYVDLIANNANIGIALMLAAKEPMHIRSLVLTSVSLYNNRSDQNLPGFGDIIEQIKSNLKEFIAPFLIISEIDNNFLDVRCAQWLSDNVPGNTMCINLNEDPMNFSEERLTRLNTILRKFLEETIWHPSKSWF